MKTIARSTFLKLALVPVTAALAGTFLVMLFYFCQPGIENSTPSGTYQDQVGLVETGSAMVSSGGVGQIL